MKYKQLYKSKKNEYKVLQGIKQPLLVGGSDVNDLLFRKGENDPHYKNKKIIHQYVTNELVIEIIQRKDFDKFEILFTFKKNNNILKTFLIKSLPKYYWHGSKYFRIKSSLYYIRYNEIEGKSSLLSKLWQIKKVFYEKYDDVYNFFNTILEKEKFTVKHLVAKLDKEEITEKDLLKFPTDMVLESLPYNDERIFYFIKKGDPKYDEIRYRYLMSKPDNLEEKFEVAFRLKYPEANNLYKELCGFNMTDDFDIDVLNNPFEETLIQLSKCYKTTNSTDESLDEY